MGVRVAERALFDAAENFAKDRTNLDAQERLCKSAIVYAAAKEHAANTRDRWKARKGNIAYR